LRDPVDQDAFELLYNRGNDLAEPFTVASTEVIQPGMEVAINPE